VHWKVYLANRWKKILLTSLAPCKRTTYPGKNSACKNPSRFPLDRTIFILFEESASSVWLPKILQQGANFAHFCPCCTSHNEHKQFPKHAFRSLSKWCYGWKCCDSNSNVAWASCTKFVHVPVRAKSASWHKVYTEDYASVCKSEKRLRVAKCCRGCRSGGAQNVLMK
jgi:hypothetical protein